ncbi:unnamed protein product, partial [Echinostoma caproni]|uniref:Uncharacterized protein n=1 Tax=Echinostoma caproni TaxID=27848 RepID=A0A183AZQ0_9TREM
MQSHQPPGGGSDASAGAGMRRNAGGCLLPQPSSSRTQTTSTSGIPAPIWLSTSARPMGSGPNLMSPGLPRVTSPPQPPPLPPPPPSPQLIPLKVRLARSKSIASPTASSLTRTDQLSGSGARRQDPLSVLARRAAFGHGPSKSLRESSSPPDPDHSRAGLKGPSSIPSSTTAQPSDSSENVPFSTTGIFLPIAHPRERNPVAVCLASIVFLAVSATIAAVFSTLILPLCLLAALIRRAGLFWANCCWYPPTTLCC